VIAIDASANQIAHAIPKVNVEYRCHKAEDLSFLPSDSVDLITVATALHWLDIEPFLEQVQRVLKPHTGVFAVWTYSSGSLDNPVADAVYHEFDQVILFSYWSSKRWLTDEYYQSLLPLFPYKPTLAEHTIERRAEMTVGQFLDLVQTYSGFQTYRAQEGEQALQNLLSELRDKLINCYTKTPGQATSEEKPDGDALPMVISSPIRLYLMRKDQSN
jgi:SAM-dependent methyltransferase